MSQVIRQAVEPLKEMAAKEAERAAISMIDRVLNDLEKHGWDLNQAVPYPNSGIGKAAYRQALAKRSLYQLLTIRAEQSRILRRRDIDMVSRSESGEATYIKQAVEAAVASYNEWASKLSAKVGDCVSAELEVSSSVWGNSVLTVTKPDGVAQKWKTQMIVNCSVHGKLFNQWPTRLIK
jgi:hypothetical protein